MNILLLMWFVIDMLLFLILLLRKSVTQHENVIRKRSIERVKSLSDRIMDRLSEIVLLLPVAFFVYILLHIASVTIIQKILEWYQGIFIVALFPLLFTYIKEKNFHINSIWRGALTILAVLFSIVGYMIDTETLEIVLEYRVALNVLITMLLISFIAVLFEIKEECEGYYLKKLPQKGIRNDLYYRTPGLMLNISNVELIKCCEKYFNEYISRYRKIRELRTIEYVNLAGVHREQWYKKVAFFMKKIILISALAITMNMFFGMLYKSLITCFLVLAFGILIACYKHIDVECLYKIAIRYCYDEWGYYLTCTSRSKFVGTNQMVGYSKFHKYIHSFLDIVALCRAVAFHDKMNGDNRICIITLNLSELFENYSDYKNDKNWAMLIPLWIAALFEFYVTGEIGDDVKNVLLKSVDDSVSADISIFLQSVWADVERKELKDGISRYIQIFEEKLYNQAG